MKGEKSLKINIVYSTSHLLMPKIIGCILVILLLIIVVTETLAKRKNAGNAPAKKPFFEENYDKKKLFGSLILFVAYVAVMDIVGFLPASIVAMFLFNVLFEDSREKKSLITCGVVSVLFPTFIWFIFGIVFNITLP